MQHFRGDAQELHDWSADALNDRPVRRRVHVAEVTAPALVLGSHQDRTPFDPLAAAAAGVAMARRRSGGSAVLVGAARVLWVDFLIGAGDPLWDDDVGRAAWWVGGLWAAVIGDRAEVWRGALVANSWSSLVCFAGLGAGEVTLRGRKVVGVCQRRTPRAALFQTAALLEWRPEEYLPLVRRFPGPPEALAGSAAGLDGGAGAGAEAAAALEAALIDRLMP